MQKLLWKTEAEMHEMQTEREEQVMQVGGQASHL